jgi:hypothetical protein
MRELEIQKGDAEIGRCHICALTFASQEDLSKHLKEAHGAPSFAEQDQTLLEELVWSVALIGGVVAYLVLVVQFAS